MDRHPPHILFVDDDPALLHSMQRDIQRLRRDWNITIYDSPLEALESFEQGEYDIVISDMRMPKMSGLELVGEIRRISSAPCIILTGSPDLNSALYAINEADVFRFYTKPCDLSLLVEGIEAALATSAFNKDCEADISALSGMNGLTTQIGLAAFNRLALSVIVVDQGGHVLFTNKSAGALLAEGDGLSVCPNNICRAHTSTLTHELTDLIIQTLDDTNDQKEDTGVMALIRPSMKRPYSVFVSPLNADMPGPSTKKLAALFISDPEKQPIPSCDHIMRLYDLSRSQASIVQYLSMGYSVENAAIEAGVTVSTARTYLKQVFSKTETSRQSELLKLVLTAPRVAAP